MPPPVNYNSPRNANNLHRSSRLLSAHPRLRRPCPCLQPPVARPAQRAESLARSWREEMWWMRRVCLNC